jgi:hypothetical protein
MNLDRPLGMLLHPERPFTFIQPSGASQRRCKADFCFIRVIRVIVVPTGRLRDDLARRIRTILTQD